MRLAVACGLAALLWGRVAAAQVCTAVATPLVFTAYDPFATLASGITGIVSVTCLTTGAVTVTYSIQLNGGTGGTIAARALSAGASRLGYQLYTNSAHSVVWGDGSGGTSVVSDSYALAALGTATKTYTAYGLITARQMASPGVYTDLVTVLVSY